MKTLVYHCKVFIPIIISQSFNNITYYLLYSNNLRADINGHYGASNIVYTPNVNYFPNLSCIICIFIKYEFYKTHENSNSFYTAFSL